MPFLPLRVQLFNWLSYEQSQLSIIKIQIENYLKEFPRAILGPRYYTGYEVGPLNRLFRHKKKPESLYPSCFAHIEVLKRPHKTSKGCHIATDSCMTQVYDKPYSHYNNRYMSFLKRNPNLYPQKEPTRQATCQFTLLRGTYPPSLPSRPHLDTKDALTYVRPTELRDHSATATYSRSQRNTSNTELHTQLPEKFI